MNVYKTVIEVIEGVEKEFVMIELSEYTILNNNTKVRALISFYRISCLINNGTK